MATDENNHKNEARDDWTGCTFRVERGPSSDQLSARTSWTSSFVLLFPARPHVGAGRPVGSTPLRVRTVFFKAVMFPLHCYFPHIVLFTPRVVSSSPLSS